MEVATLEIHLNKIPELEEAIGNIESPDYTQLQNVPSSFPPSAHAHAPSEVTGTAVVANDARLTDARAPTTHNQAISTITNLQTTLDGKAASSHAHSPSEVTGTAVITSDSRLSDARTPLAHTHTDQPVKMVVLANDTLAQALATNINTQITVTAARTLTTTVPPAGTGCAIKVLTSGTSSYVITFGSGFKPTGTLATGTANARVFIINWLSDGTNLYEAGRTAAMVA